MTGCKITSRATAGLNARLQSFKLHLKNAMSKIGHLPVLRPCFARPFRVAPRLALLLGTLSVLSGQSYPAQPIQDHVRERARYLASFGSFVQWPGNVRPQSLSVCVLGKDPFGALLDDAVSRQKLEGKQQIVVRTNSARDAVARCHVLYISSAEQMRWKSILAELGTAPILTVSDIPQFAEHGGMIEFVQANGRVRFDVNTFAAGKARLGLSSQLLKVAASVKHSEVRE